MMNKEQYQRTFGVLHASDDFLKEEIFMQPKKQFSVRRTICLCAAVIAILAMATVCYAADVGGIQRTVQVWIRGEQTTAVMDVQDGEYTMTWQDNDGVTHERGGGGVAYDLFGRERPLTQEELMECMDQPEVEYNDDGSVWLYYKNQAMEITDRFDDDGICYAQVMDGEDTLYVTIKYGSAMAMSPRGYIQPDTFD